MHIAVADLTLPVNALVIAAILIYLQNQFLHLPFIKDRCIAQLALVSLVTLVALTGLMIQYAVESILGIVDPGPLVIIIVLLIIAILVILILQHALPFWKKAKMLPLLRKLKDILVKIQTGGGVGTLDDKEKEELQKGVDEVLPLVDDVKIDPKTFSDAEKKLIRELLKQLREDVQSPNLPEPLKKAIEKLIEKLKPLE